MNSNCQAATLYEDGDPLIVDSDAQDFFSTEKTKTQQRLINNMAQGESDEMQPNIRPLSRATLPQEIVKAIAELIMRRVWKPGDMIPSEKELALQFGVGRSTIREAVKSLVVVGVLEARAGEGSFVRESTSELLSGAFRWGLLLGERNLGDLVDIRILIEVECARRAACKHDAELIARLKQTLRNMEAEEHDHRVFMENDTRFHIEIAKSADNTIFENIGFTIQSIVRIWYHKTYFIPETKEKTIAEHQKIIDGIASGDADLAGNAMRSHLIEASERLRRILPSASGIDSKR